MLLLFSCKVRLTLVTPWTSACYTPLSMGFPRQEDWSGLLFPSPWGSSPPRGRTHVSCIAGKFFITESPGKPPISCTVPLIYSHEGSTRESQRQIFHIDRRLLAMKLLSFCSHRIYVVVQNIYLNEASLFMTWWMMSILMLCGLCLGRVRCEEQTMFLLHFLHLCLHSSQEHLSC